MRHIAEVIRRAFEEAFEQQWPEEDVAFGTWPPGARKMTFGMERPLDDIGQSQPYLASPYGLFMGSVVRWYLEGDTEWYAVSEVLTEPSRFGVEIVNLRGNIKSEKGNIAMKLEDALEQDRAQRRFSIISFDTDFSANVKLVRRQLEQKNFIGFIGGHSPDFEFANFAIKELVEIAAQLDESCKSSGDPLREGDWTGIMNSGEFEKRYVELSLRRPLALKGENWGRRLASYATLHPHRVDNAKERPLIGEVRAALQGRRADYDYQRDRFDFDQKTFNLIRRSKH